MVELEVVIFKIHQITSYTITNFMGFSVVSQILVIGVYDNGEDGTGKIVAPFSQASHDCGEFSVMYGVILFGFIEGLGVIAYSS